VPRVLLADLPGEHEEVVLLQESDRSHDRVLKVRLVEHHRLLGDRVGERCDERDAEEVALAKLQRRDQRLDVRERRLLRADGVDAVEGGLGDGQIGHRLRAPHSQGCVEDGAANDHTFRERKFRANRAR
jgi:hypothetical protein